MFVEGDGSTEATQKFRDCVQACISGHYLSTAPVEAAATNAASSAMNSGMITSFDYLGMVLTRWNSCLDSRFRNGRCDHWHRIYWRRCLIHTNWRCKLTRRPNCRCRSSWSLRPLRVIIFRPVSFIGRAIWLFWTNTENRGPLMIRGPIVRDCVFLRSFVFRPCYCCTVALSFWRQG